MTVQNTTTTWVPDAADFGTRLALIRHHMGWNQKEAALACGFPQNSWRGWEEGRHPRDLAAVAQRISRRTGVDEFWLLTGRTNDKEPPRPPEGWTRGPGGAPGGTRTHQPSGWEPEGEDALDDVAWAASFRELVAA